MSDNLYKFKKRVHPEWYENGPVKIYTKEERDEWEKNRDPMIDLKISMQEGLSEATIKWLDGLDLTRAESCYNEVMEGFKESGPGWEGE